MCLSAAAAVVACHSRHALGASTRGRCLTHLFPGAIPSVYQLWGIERSHLANAAATAAAVRPHDATLEKRVKMHVAATILEYTEKSWVSKQPHAKGRLYLPSRFRCTWYAGYAC